MKSRNKLKAQKKILNYNITNYQKSLIYSHPSASNSENIFGGTPSGINGNSLMNFNSILSELKRLVKIKNLQTGFKYNTSVYKKLKSF